MFWKTEKKREFSAENLFKEMEMLYIRNINSITDSSFFELNEVSLRILSDYIFISIGEKIDYTFDKTEPCYFFGVPVKINENLSYNQLKLNIK